MGESDTAAVWVWNGTVGATGEDFRRDWEGCRVEAGMAERYIVVVGRTGVEGCFAIGAAAGPRRDAWMRTPGRDWSL